MREWAALDVRYAGDSRPGGEIDGARCAGARTIGGSAPTGSAPPTRWQHTAAFTYASDMTLLGASLVPPGSHLSLRQRAGRLAGPHDLVPPAVPGRPVVALRPAQPVSVRWPRADLRECLHPGRPARCQRAPRRA